MKKTLLAVVLCGYFFGVFGAFISIVVELRKTETTALYIFTEAFSRSWTWPVELFHFFFG